MKKLLTVFFVAAFATPACGSDPGSGVDGNKKASELTAAERSTVCAFFISQAGGPGETVCSMSDGVEVSASVPTQAECETEGELPSECTVSTIEACAVSSGGEACKLTETNECGAYIVCALSSL